MERRLAISGRHMCDVLVAGSGAGGFATALTALKRGLDVLMVEKDALFGGTTAYSMGVIWIPGNGYLPPDAREADRRAARDYLAHHAGNRYDAFRVDAFLEAGPQMVALFECEGFAVFSPAPTWADYRPLEPGGSSGGRSLVPDGYDGSMLGAWFESLRPPVKTMMGFGGMMIGRTDVPHLFKMTQSWRSAAHVVGLVARYGRDRLTHRRGTRLVNGNGLIARMARHVLDRGMDLWLSFPVVELIQADGRVTGAIVTRQDRIVSVAARCGVVLATGGFPRTTNSPGGSSAIVQPERTTHCFRPRLTPATARGSRRRRADICPRTCTTRPPGRPCRLCLNPTAQKFRSRISSIAPSPALSPSTATESASSTRRGLVTNSCRP